MKTEIKDVPITMPDRVPVRMGMEIFELDKLNCGTAREVKQSPTYYKAVRYSGKSRYIIVTSRVVAVNTSANSRSFTVKSKRGCESTYSVKDTCLPDGMFGKLESIKARKRKLDLEDARSAENRIGRNLSKIQELKTEITKEKNLTKALKAIK